MDLEPEIPPPTPRRLSHAGKAIRRAKREIRSELKLADWSNLGYWKPDAPKLTPALENLKRIHCSDVSAAAFVERFERPAQPVLIDGFAEGTPALSWTQQSLLHRFKNVKFKCGEDDDVGPTSFALPGAAR